jgi:hypothetical protein
VGGNTDVGRRAEEGLLTSEAERPPARPIRSERSAPLRTVAVVASVCVLAALYLVFVVHFSVNELARDDWTVVPLIHAQLHGRLTWSQLWKRHNENRMLVPNLIFVMVGVLTYDNAQVLMFMSALLFIGTFVLLLVIVRSYFDRPVTPLPVLMLGVVWFSLVDWQNALWAFQFAWYLILALLIAMLFVLLVLPRGRLTLGLALLLAVVASFSSLQGLLLWPVGLVCLLWTTSVRPNPQRHRDIQRLSIWVLVAACTTAIYFWHLHTGYQPTGRWGRYSNTSPTFAVRHAASTMKFFLASVGNTVPLSTHSLSTGATELVGAVICALAVFVVVRSVRHRRITRRIECLPTTLILFGVLMDAATAIARAKFGGSLVSRYTMPGLLILIGILLYAWVHIPLGRGPNAFRKSQIVAGSFLAAFLVLQLVMASQVGITAAKTYKQDLVIGARIITNYDRIPSVYQSCYVNAGADHYSLPLLKNSTVTMLKADQLSVFAAGSDQAYRAEGLPILPRCSAGRAGHRRAHKRTRG